MSNIWRRYIQRKAKKQHNHDINRGIIYTALRSAAWFPSGILGGLCFGSYHDLDISAEVAEYSNPQIRPTDTGCCPLCSWSYVSVMGFVIFPYSCDYAHKTRESVWVCVCLLSSFFIQPQIIGRSLTRIPNAQHFHSNPRVDVQLRVCGEETSQ